MELLEPDRIAELLSSLGERLELARTPLSDGFRQELLGALRYLGVEDADLGD